MVHRTDDACAPDVRQRRSAVLARVRFTQIDGGAFSLIAALSLACAGSGESGAAPSANSSPSAMVGAQPPAASSADTTASAPPVATPAATAVEAPVNGGTPLAGANDPDSTLAGAQGSSDTTLADAGAAAMGSGSGEVVPGSDDGLAAECGLPATVSFRQDVQPFLIASCGGGSGCHVVDASSTMGSGGYNHAYDWATAGAHTSSCPDGPLRFEVLVDVSETANPPTCSRSRKMPPPDATGAGQRAPLTRCQIAALQAWLDEPRVTQTHRPDDSSPATPYAMPPFN